LSWFPDALPAFMPHGHCYYWRADLLSLHLGADAVIALSYFSIPVAMGHLVLRRRDVVFGRIFLMFAAFILLCGVTHVMGAVTIWQPLYYTEGLLKLATALVSATTAIVLWRLMPRAIALPSHHRLRELADEREAARDQARGAEHELQLILDAVGEGICRVDRDGHVRFANQAGTRLLGAAASDLRGRHYLDVVHIASSDDSEASHDPVAQALAEAMPQAATAATLTRPNGRRFPADVQVTPLRDAAGEPAGAVITLRDLSAERAQQARLARSYSLLEKTNRLARVGAWSYDMTSGELWWSDVTCRLFGHPIGYRPGLEEAFDYFAEGGPRQELLAAFGRCLRTGLPYDLELTVCTVDGVERRVRVLGEPEYDGERPVRVLGAIQDITELRAAEAESRERDARLAGISRHAPGVPFELHCRPDTGTAWVPYLGDRAPRILGIGQQALAEDFTPLLDRIVPEDRETLRDLLRTDGAGRRGEPLDFRIDFTEPDGGGRREWLQAVATPEAQPDGLLIWRGFVTNITRRKRLEAELRQLAYYDSLTGLPNRLQLEDHLAQAVTHARRGGGTVAVLYLDVDDFKNINDGWGHGVGDDALRALAGRVAEEMPPQARLARIGGDELVLVLEAAPAEAVTALVERLRASLQRPLTAGRHGFALRVSIGVARYPDDARDAGRLLQYADAALYQAKRDGGNCTAWYRPALTEEALDRVHLEGELRRALEQGGLRLALQPLYRLGDGREAGAEALVRWQHPSEGWISPGRFIPMAEATGLIRPLGEAMLLAVCRHLAAARDLPPGYRISVNVSPRQLEMPSFVPGLEAMLAATGARPEALELEITEEAFVRREATLIACLDRVRGLGVSVAIDDFGTGFASLQYLKRLPVDKLKIDRTFVHGIPGDRDNLAIVRTAHALAVQFGLQVVAEGVETETEAQALRGIGVALAQGYLFARPAVIRGLGEMPGSIAAEAE